MKKYIFVSFVLSTALIFLTSCSKEFDNVKGTYKISDRLGEFEIKSDGKVYFKKLDVEGQAKIDKNQIAILLPSGVTYFFTKKADGTLREGASNISEKLLPGPRKPTKKDLVPGRPCPLCGHIFQPPGYNPSANSQPPMPPQGGMPPQGMPGAMSPQGMISPQGTLPQGGMMPPPTAKVKKPKTQNTKSE